jgi:hypothetical protein
VSKDSWRLRGLRLVGLLNLTELYWQESGSKAIDWETDKLIVLQIFREPVQAGHWASMIINRTRPNQSLAVFADSLPTYSRNSFRDLQEILQHTYRFQTMSLWEQNSVARGRDQWLWGVRVIFPNALCTCLREARTATNGMQGSKSSARTNNSRCGTLTAFCNEHIYAWRRR